MSCHRRDASLPALGVDRSSWREDIEMADQAQYQGTRVRVLENTDLQCGGVDG